MADLSPDEAQLAARLGDAIFDRFQARMTDAPRCIAVTKHEQQCLKDAVAVGCGKFCATHARMFSDGRIDRFGRPRDPAPKSRKKPLGQAGLA